MKLIKFLISLFLITISLNTVQAQYSTTKMNILSQEFLSPPLDYAPYVLWYWIGYNISESGITKDLEAMKEAGIRGAYIYQTNSSFGNYTKGISYFNDGWWKMLKNASSEARRLGIVLGIMQCPGWSESGGPWISPEQSMQKVVWTEKTVTGPFLFSGKLLQPEAKMDYYREIAVLAVPNGVIPSDKIINLSSKMSADGSLTWQIPEGEYTIFRFGHTTTGVSPHPIPGDIKALEADKLSKEAMEFHIRYVLDALRENLGEYIGTTLKTILWDSNESGSLNWTPKMREEFKKRKGYDIIPWLPVLAGRIVVDEKQTERFMYDLKTVISDMFNEYGFGIPVERINQTGMLAELQPYGNIVFNVNEATTIADIPMTEFWTGTKGPDLSHWGQEKRYYELSAAAAPVGKNIVSAESFTGIALNSMWSESPTMLKRVGDCAYAKGVNRFNLNMWTLQPFSDDVVPGLAVGYWGTHLGRNQTWYEPGKAWIKYLTRCQYLLQQGEIVADFLSLDDFIKGGDVVSEKTLLNKVSVKDRMIVTEAERTYPLLVLPDKKEMSVAVACKIKEIVDRGGTIYGPKPFELTELNECSHRDKEVETIGNELWGKIDGQAIKENRYGKGKVIWGYPLADVLKQVHGAPDVEMNGDQVNKKVQYCYWCAVNSRNNLTPVGVKENVDYYIEEGYGYRKDSPRQDSIAPVVWTHRRAGDTDIYFFANTVNRNYTFTADLRVINKQPEFWFPETGETREAKDWLPTDTGCRVKMSLDGKNSVFVVFREKSVQSDFIENIETKVADSLYRVWGDGTGGWAVQSRSPGSFRLRSEKDSSFMAIIDAVPFPVVVDSGWKVVFNPATAQEPFTVNFSDLGSWTKSNDARIKYFSGTATYSTSFELPAELVCDEIVVKLNLGDVRELASVSINGKPVAVLWHPPYVTDITKFVRPGKNEMSVAVTNTWANRLIGDEQYPTDCRYGKYLLYHRVNEQGINPLVGASLTVLPDWLVKDEPRPSLQRSTFSSWNYFTKDSPLLPSGLLSPVKLEFEKIAPFR